MKKTLNLILIAMIFAGCSVDEDENKKIKPFVINIPSSKALVSQPAGLSDIHALNDGDEWFVYSKFELISDHGTTQTIENFALDTNYVLPVTAGAYKMKAVLVNSWLGYTGVADPDITAETYRGIKDIFIPEGTAEINESLDIYQIYNKVFLAILQPKPGTANKSLSS